MKKGVTAWLLAAAALGASAAEWAVRDLAARPEWKDHAWVAGRFAEGDSRLHGTNLVAWMTFPAGRGFALFYGVNTAGQQVDHRVSAASAAQGTRGRSLSAAELREIESAVRRLPAGGPPRAPHQTVLVRTQVDGKWVVRSYEVGKLPEAVEGLIRVVGKRQEEYPDSGAAAR